MEGAKGYKYPHSVGYYSTCGMPIECEDDSLGLLSNGTDSNVPFHDNLTVGHHCIKSRSRGN